MYITNGGIRMNIKDFRGNFLSKILQRGQMYLKDKRVSKPEHDDNGNNTFTVEGTDDYTVSVYISPEGELSGLSCDCPYEGFALCTAQTKVGRPHGAARQNGNGAPDGYGGRAEQGVLRQYKGIPYIAESRRHGT